MFKYRPVAVIISLCFFTTLAMNPHSVFAQSKQDKSRAKEHFRSGNALTKVEDFDTAALEFETSYRFYPTKSALFNLAECYRALHRYGDALKAYEELKLDFQDKMNKSMTKQVDQALAELRLLVSYLEVAVSQPDATIKIDDRVVGTSPLESRLVVGPGSHVLTAELEGYQKFETNLRLLSKEEKLVTIELVPLQLELAPTPEAIQEDKTDLQMQDEVSDGVHPGINVWFWGSLGGTVVTGTLAGVFGAQWGNNDDVFNKAEKTYLAEGTEESHSALAQASEDVTASKNLTIAFSVATGVLLTSTIVSAIVKSTAGNKETALTINPSGLVVSF